jgi:hypothetical protein
MKHAIHKLFAALILISPLVSNCLLGQSGTKSTPIAFARPIDELRKSWAPNKRWGQQPGISPEEKQAREGIVRTANEVLDAFATYSPQDAIKMIVGTWMTYHNPYANAWRGPAVIDSLRAVLKYISGAIMPYPGASNSIVYKSDALNTLQQSLIQALQKSGFQPSQDQETFKQQIANLADQKILNAWANACAGFITWMLGSSTSWNTFHEYRRWVYIDTLCDLLKNIFDITANTPVQRTYMFSNLSQHPAIITPSVCGYPTTDANNRFNAKPDESGIRVEPGQSTGFYGSCPLDGFVVQLVQPENRWAIIKQIDYFIPAIIGGNWGISEKQGILIGQ